MKLPWNRVGDELRAELSQLSQDYENYKRETEGLIRDYQKRIEELQRENEELKKAMRTNIIERSVGALYEDGMDYGLRFLGREKEDERNFQTRFPILDGIPHSYNLLQAELFGIWSNIVDTVTNYRILRCEKIERDLGINLEKVKNAYRIAGDYLKRQFYSPEIYYLVSRLIPYLPFRPLPDYYPQRPPSYIVRHFPKTPKTDIRWDSTYPANISLDSTYLPNTESSKTNASLDISDSYYPFPKTPKTDIRWDTAK